MDLEKSGVQGVINGAATRSAQSELDKTCGKGNRKLKKQINQMKTLGRSHKH